MYTFLVILSIIIALLLIIVVLLQNSKGTGLAGSAFGGTSNAVLGVRRTADYLTKATITLAVILAILAVLSNYVIPGKYTQNNSNFIEKAQKTQQAPTTPVTPPSTPSTPAPGIPGN